MLLVFIMLFFPLAKCVPPAYIPPIKDQDNAKRDVVIEITSTWVWNM
jgi:hypothetical protein